MAARTAAASVTATPSAAAGFALVAGVAEDRVAHRAGAPEDAALDDARTGPDGGRPRRRALARRVATIHELRGVKGLRGVVALPLHDERLDGRSERSPRGRAPPCARPAADLPPARPRSPRPLARWKKPGRHSRCIEPPPLSPSSRHRQVAPPTSQRRGPRRRRRTHTLRHRPRGRVDPNVAVRGPKWFDRDKLNTFTGNGVGCITRSSACPALTKHRSSSSARKPRRRSRSVPAWPTVARRRPRRPPAGRSMAAASCPGVRASLLSYQHKHHRTSLRRGIIRTAPKNDASPALAPTASGAPTLAVSKTAKLEPSDKVETTSPADGFEAPIAACRR